MLADGTRLPAELVVMAVGIRANAALAKEAGITVNRGIVVDAAMRTSRSRHLRGRRVRGGRGAGVRPRRAALRDGKRARGATGRRWRIASAERFRPSATATKLKVTGINLFSAGDFADGKDREEIVLRDAARGVYKRIVLKDNRIVGVVMYGETSDGAWFFDLLKQRRRYLRDARNTDLWAELRGRRPAGPYGGRCSIAA